MQKQGKKGNGILSPQAHCHLMVVKEEVDFTKGMVMLFGDFFFMDDSSNGEKT